VNSIQKNNHWDYSYTTLPQKFFKKTMPTRVSKPELILWNKKLIKEIGFDFRIESKEELSELFSGNFIPPEMSPFSSAYAGHQFGNFTMLGDGRAICLGEILNNKNERYDVQLKGAGRTPFSRGGDGRATLSSVLREYIMSEAMHSLGIQTTRSLAIVKTGEKVYRDTVQDGGILTRIASSHIRVGTFEYAYQYLESDELLKLVDYTIQRHFPECIEDSNPYLNFLSRVMEKNLDLIIEWLRVGFIHGVMNTDNMSISGETIDYGPCAFMNVYSPNTVFSSIDRMGRYSFGNQISIAHWNTACLANSLLPLFDDDLNKAVDLAKSILDKYPEMYRVKWQKMMGEKIGIDSILTEDISLVQELLNWMESNQVDYTNTFVNLMDILPFSVESFMSDDFQKWKSKWLILLEKYNTTKKDAIALMSKKNPIYIPRNYKIELVLQSAVEGELEPYLELLSVLQDPYKWKEGFDSYMQPPKEGDSNYRTYCNT
jgi:serine/tyrosine/threonine adenylyltransferase